MSGYTKLDMVARDCGYAEGRRYGDAISWIKGDSEIVARVGVRFQVLDVWIKDEGVTVWKAEGANKVGQLVRHLHRSGAFPDAEVSA